MIYKDLIKIFGKKRVYRVIAEQSGWSYGYAKVLIESGLAVPDIIEKSIAKNQYWSYNYAIFLIQMKWMFLILLKRALLKIRYGLMNMLNS